jgi:glycine cleavage system H protein
MIDGSPQYLAFMMGEYRADFPVDRRYVTNHMWAVPCGEKRYRFGLTAYAVRLLQDVYFLDWIIDPGTPITNRQAIGSIESKKAESDIFAPSAGTLIQVNEETLSDPSAINVEPYGAGWLLEIETETVDLLSPEAYIQHLDSAWKVAERTIKGQIH